MNKIVAEFLAYANANRIYDYYFFTQDQCLRLGLTYENFDELIDGLRSAEDVVEVNCQGDELHIYFK